MNQLIHDLSEVEKNAKYYRTKELPMKNEPKPRPTSLPIPRVQEKEIIEEKRVVSTPDLSRKNKEEKINTQGSLYRMGRF
jgi:hypothetical protein